MNIRTRIASLAATAAVATTFAIAGAAPAQAAGHVNVLAHQCSTSRHTTCIEQVKRGSHRIVVRDQHGHEHRYTGHQAILGGLKRWSVPCSEEDSPRCYWDASEAGNGVGQSFFVIGGHAEGEGKLVYIRKI